MTRPKISYAKVKAAIPNSGGVITLIAKRAGYSWGAVREFIKNNPELEQMLRDEEDTIDDMAESTLIKSIRNGDEATARWWLTRRRRNRYGDNIDLTTAGKAFNIIQIVEHKDDDNSNQTQLSPSDND
jgi:hypothetical protein